MPRGPLQRHPGLTDHWQRPSETLQLSTVSDTRQLLDTIEGKYLAREKIKIVLNRVSRQNRLHVPDVERTLGHPVAAQIPNDGRTVPASINKGVPFILSHPGSPVGQCVR